MKVLFFRCVFPVLVFFVSTVVYGQEMKFSPITEENVFDKQPVLSIDQDSKGRLWFAGEANLFMYNSREVQNLVDIDTSFKKLGYITKLLVDPHDVLFIASSTHLFLYDIKQRRWLSEGRSPFKKKLTINSMEYIDGKVYIAAAEGLYTAQKTGNHYILKKGLKRSNVQYITKTEKGQYVLGSTAGIELLKLNGAQFEVMDNLNIPLVEASSYVFPTLLADKASLWVGTKFSGLYKFDFEQKTWTNYNERNSRLLSDNVRKVIKDSSGRLLIGTLKGLSVYQEGNNEFSNYKHNSLSKYSLSQNSIYDIFIDQQKIVWIGTYFGGINAVYPKYFDVQSLSTQSVLQGRLNSDIISSMGESADGYWVGTEEEGIHFVRKDRKQVKGLAHLTTSNLVKDLFVRNNKLYIAQYAGGYSVYDIKQNKVTQYPLEPPNKYHLRNNVYSIYVDSLENVYLGTNAGLYYVRAGKSPEFEKSLPEAVVSSIKSDGRGNLYVLISGKLYEKKVGATQFNSVPFEENGAVNGFYVARNDEVWVTTEDKVFHLTGRAEAKLILQTKYNPLGWPMVVGDTLWVTSKQGLLFFDLKDQYSNLLNQYDGIQVKNLQRSKMFYSEDDNLFLLTLSGLISIQPKQIKFNKTAPNNIVDRIAVNGHKIGFDRLTFNRELKRYQLKLNHDENFITIDFSSSNFIKPAKNRYRYKLEGFEKNWTESSRPEARYTYIPQGNYTLLLYSSNNDAVWSNKPLELEIIVLPPFWKTWWAFLLYVIVAVVLLHFCIKFIVERELLLNAKQTYANKIKFFTQISHEIRTPLTLITVPIEEIVKETESLPLVKSKALRLKKNANKLLDIVNELLDFKKFEDGYESLDREPVELRSYLEDFFYLFSDLALSKRLNYYIKGIEDNMVVDIDRKQFDKVLFNLLSNAIKYSEEGGTIFLNVYGTLKSVQVEIADNGIGVAENKQFEIFEEYYRADNAKETIGTGIGLALTKKIIEQHDGYIRCVTEQVEGKTFTVFQITLPRAEGKSVLPKDGVDMAVSPALPMSKAELLEQRTLLFVEDNVELVNMMVPILEDQYEVIVARDGEEGAEIAIQRMPDIIVSDVMMPRMNGMEMCHIIKSNIVTSHIPIIMLTADNTPDSQMNSLRYGANMYLQKPFDTQMLLYSIKNFLDISQRKREAFDMERPQLLPVADQQFLTKMEGIIEANLMNVSFGVDFLAKEMGMSQPVLYKKLNAVTNLSVNNFIKNYRFKKATQLLRSESNISEVAYAIGFSDRKYFSKEFKKHFGKTPTDYIKEDL